MIGTSCLTTAEGPCRLTAAAEQPGTEEGLIYINITKLAENGTVAAHADEVIALTADENISVLGFGSGDPKPVYNYTGTETKTFNGRALLVVQKKDPNKGAAVTISGPSGSVTLSV